MLSITLLCIDDDTLTPYFFAVSNDIFLSDQRSINSFCSTLVSICYFFLSFPLLHLIVRHKLISQLKHFDVRLCLDLASLLPQLGQGWCFLSNSLLRTLPHLYLLIKKARHLLIYLHNSYIMLRNA